MPGRLPEPSASSDAGKWFATTHWSVVLAAGHASSPGAQDALEKLCRAYWYPLYAYVRRQGHSAEDAQDLTQEFFAHLLAKRLLQRANRGRGKFRSFLLTSLNHFLVHEWGARPRGQARRQPCSPVLGPGFR
jgi:RNA polymerase sigma-70 factor (ECF subfamily)